MKSITLLFLAFFLTGCIRPITIGILRQSDFVQHILDANPQTNGKAKVSIDKENNILIEINVTVSDRAAFRESFENIREGTSEYIRSEAQPFRVKTKNYFFSLPEE